MLRCIMAWALVAIATTAAAQPTASGRVDRERALSGADLANALRAGGYTLIFRHAATDQTQHDQMPMPLTDCARQRNLTEGGRAQARLIGEGLAALRVPLGEVIASPMCRTMDTARLIAGRATPQTWVLGFDTAVKDGPFDQEPLRKLVRTAPAEGTNRIVAGHNSSFEQAVGPPTLEEGEGAVVRAIDGKPVVIARLRPGDWKELAASGKRSAAPDPGFALEGAALSKALRAGGLTIFFRHAATDRSQQDRPDLVAADCAMQRNLDERGRAQARAIGEAVARIGVPVGDVVASPYCRAMQTAKAVSGKAPRVDDAIRGRAAPGGGAIDFAGLEALLGARVKKDEPVRIIVGHGNGFEAVAGVPRLEEGEAVVLRSAFVGWTVVARLRAGDWAALPTP